MTNLTHHITTAMRLYASKKFTEAQAQYEAALALDPTYTIALHGISACQFQQEQWDTSIATAEKILTIDPNDADAQGHISRCWMRKGDVPRAEAEAAKEKVIRWRLQLKEQKAAEDAKKSSGG
jgi:tetratricopeptide (TPR) repeat protein